MVTMSRQFVVIGADIGGTKIKLGAVEVTPDGPSDRVVAAEQVPTQRAAPSAFYDVLADGVRLLDLRAVQMGAHVLPLLAVAHPGRFLPDGTLARGTTPNLGTAPGQFDGCSPSRELGQRLQVRVIAENDAVAQMRFGLDLLLRDAAIRLRLLGETVIYIGPGTGMGGGVARVGRDGAVTPVTDGHFFDLQVPGYGDGTLTAEELLTGPAIARLVVEANRRLAVPIHPARGGRLDELLAMGTAAPAEQRAVALEIARRQGVLLAGVIEAIHAGSIVKVRLEPTPDGRIVRHIDELDRAWPEADKTIVRGVRRVVFGGFLGTSRFLGAEVRSWALAELARRGLDAVEIFQIPIDSADAGLLGIVRAIPSAALQKVSDTFS